MNAWRAARDCQRVFRGALGRRIANVLRTARRHALETNAVTRIAAWWRGWNTRTQVRAFVAVREYRRVGDLAATKVQALARGRIARGRQRELAADKVEKERRQKAVVHCQRVIRGHNGRTRWEVGARMKEALFLAAPLKAKLETLLAEWTERTEKFAAVVDELDGMTAQTDDIEGQLVRMMQTTSVCVSAACGATMLRYYITRYLLTTRFSPPPHRRYTDTATITGHLKRYLTQFLKIHFAEILQQSRVRYDELAPLRARLEFQVATVDRQVRETRRALVPLTEGVSADTRRKRIARLRATVRRFDTAAAAVQAFWRGSGVRAAYGAWDREAWVALLDADLGLLRYVNAFSQERSWGEPLAAKIFGTLDVFSGWVEASDGRVGLQFWRHLASGTARYVGPRANLDKDDPGRAVPSEDGTADAFGERLAELGPEWELRWHAESGNGVHVRKDGSRVQWSMSPPALGGLPPRRPRGDATYFRRGADEAGAVFAGGWRRHAGGVYSQGTTDHGDWSPAGLVFYDDGRAPDVF